MTENDSYPDHIQTREDRFAYTCEHHASWFHFLATRNLISILSLEAEDVVQDAFLEAWSGLSGYREEGSMRNWISTFVVWIAWARNKKRDPLFRASSALLDDHALPVHSHSSFASHLERQDILGRILPMLSDAQQEFLRLWSQGMFVGQMSANDNRGRLGRIKRRMRSIAQRKKISF